MLSILTENHGTLQYHRYEFVKIRFACDGEKEEWKAGDWLWESKEGTGIKFGPGDELRVKEHQCWDKIVSVSWNAAFDREQEAERARRKAEREEELKRQQEREQEREAEERRQIAAGMSAML